MTTNFGENLKSFDIDGKNGVDEQDIKKFEENLNTFKTIGEQVKYIDTFHYGFNELKEEDRNKLISHIEKKLENGDNHILQRTLMWLKFPNGIENIQNFNKKIETENKKRNELNQMEINEEKRIENKKYLNSKNFNRLINKINSINNNFSNILVNFYNKINLFDINGGDIDINISNDLQKKISKNFINLLSQIEDYIDKNKGKEINLNIFNKSISNLNNLIPEKIEADILPISIAGGKVICNSILHYGKKEGKEIKNINIDFSKLKNISFSDIGNKILNLEGSDIKKGFSIIVEGIKSILASLVGEGEKILKNILKNLEDIPKFLGKKLYKFRYFKIVIEKLIPILLTFASSTKILKLINPLMNLGKIGKKAKILKNIVKTKKISIVNKVLNSEKFIKAEEKINKLSPKFLSDSVNIRKILEKTISPDMPQKIKNNLGKKIFTKLLTIMDEKTAYNRVNKTLNEYGINFDFSTQTNYQNNNN